MSPPEYMPTSGVSQSDAPPPVRPQSPAQSDPKGPAFAQLYHGFGADRRLVPNDLRIMMALLYHSWRQIDRCDVADSTLEEYTGFSNKTVRRSLANLDKLGLIGREDVPYRANNMTGRVIILRWITDPALIPDPPPEKDTAPDNRNHRSRATDTERVHHRSRATDASTSIGHGRPRPSVTGDRGPWSRATDKEYSEDFEDDDPEVEVVLLRVFRPDDPEAFPLAGRPDDDPEVMAARADFQKAAEALMGMFEPSGLADPPILIERALQIATPPVQGRSATSAGPVVHSAPGPAGDVADLVPATPDDEPFLRDKAERIFGPGRPATREVLEMIPAWLDHLAGKTTRPVAWIEEAFLGAASPKVGSKAGYISGALRKMISEGKAAKEAAPQASRPAAGSRVGSGTLQSRRAEEARIAAAERDLRDRWDRLPEAERAAIRATVEATPEIQGLAAKFREVGIMADCLKAMEDRE